MAQIKRDYPKLAKDIIREVGGKENIVNATRCATRLRLSFKRDSRGSKGKSSRTYRSYNCCRKFRTIPSSYRNSCWRSL